MKAQFVTKPVPDYSHPLQFLHFRKNHTVIKIKEVRRFFLKFLFWTVVVTAILVGLMWLGEKGLEKDEINQCLQYQKDATKYPKFFMTLADIKMCEARNISIIK